MWSVCVVLAALTLLVKGEPPVPQSQYGAPSSGGYPSGGPGGFSSGHGFGSGGSNGGGDEPNYTHEQDFQRNPGVIWGQYTVQLPDGRTQKVEYDADESGFHPVITFEDPRDSQGGYGQGGYGQGGSHGGSGGYK